MVHIAHVPELWPSWATSSGSAIESTKDTVGRVDSAAALCVTSNTTTLLADVQHRMRLESRVNVSDSGWPSCAHLMMGADAVCTARAHTHTR
jgi:hypothetical protein